MSDSAPIRIFITKDGTEVSVSEWQEADALSWGWTPKGQSVVPSVAPVVPAIDPIPLTLADLTAALPRSAR